jgi:DNA-binding winged helix-turn-helix (wHTH) protein
MNSRAIYGFDEYRLDSARRELWRGDDLISVQPKVLDCLLYLIERRDRAVSRDELIAAVWGKVDIPYSLLGQLITKVRRTLGRAGNDQHLIRTIPRFGFRWVSAMTDDAADSVMGRSSSGSVETPKTRRWTTRIVPTMLLVAASSVVIGGSWLYWTRRASPLAGSTRSWPAETDAVAVLPVRVAAAGQWSWVRLGMMDLVGDRLRSAGQPVVPSENIMALSGSSPSERLPEAIREVTGARYIVAPAAARGEDSWRVRLRVESADGDDYTVEASASDVTEAGREASDQLLERLGRRVDREAGGAAAGSDDELLARAKAALLTNDIDAARTILESAPPASRQSPELRRRLSQMDYRSGRLQAASDRLAALASELGAESAPRLRAAVLTDYGLIAIYLDRPLEAEGRFAEAISLLAREDYPFELGRAHLGLAMVYTMQRDFEHSGPEFSKARVAFGLTGDAAALATIEYDEGAIEAMRDRFAEAKPIIERAAARFERLDMRDELLNARASSIDASLALLESSEAIAIGTRTQALLADVQNPRTRREFQLQWARALSAAGRWTEARATFDDLARDEASQQQSPMFPGRVAAYRAVLALDAGDADSAQALAARALDTLMLPDYVRERSLAWSIRIRALGLLGRAAEATTEADRFSEWAARQGVSTVSARANLIAAEQAGVANGHAAATRLYDLSLRQAVDAGVPATLADVVGSYGIVLIAEGDLDRTSAVIGRVARFAEHDFESAVLLTRLHRALDRRDAWQSSLDQARALAGERTMPPDLLLPPPARLSGGPAY